ncbi:phospholipid-transporting ATPase IK [Tympanuchus pallidicinctus]|uniref:phospholipid-transporting ATPase IK n=1 Tax=Tympanuchus pallidicinctus TaxID=109042 RepID=UPI002287588D|nr:phospholipid-transporting ATPase IK [Tympanuchus pallidicinctus]
MGPGRGGSMDGQDPALGCEREQKGQPAFTWEVQANNRAQNEQLRKKSAFCVSKKKYAGNAIKTAKYNVLTFLPLNLYEQFHRMANVYFVFVILLQTFPEISTLPWYTLLFPLSCLLTIRALRDLMDDIGRHQSDRNINSRPCEILSGESFRWQKWRDVCVGDVVRLHKDSLVPADMLLLCSSEPSSLCYVETCDIDGETNLKFRQALLVTHQELTSEESLAAFDGRVTCEEPNSRMHSFTGVLQWRGETHALDGDRILLRGCKLRHTDTCYGLVLYAGSDSKIMRNCGKIKRKKTKLDRMMDRLVVIIFLVLLVTSLCLAIASGFWAKMFQEKHSYLAALYKHTAPAKQAFFSFWGFTILLSVIIPMSMYITFEFIYLVNSFFINWDLEMYYAVKDIPAKARSTSLNDQLGQVEYIFSDKTGTLTQNIMSFKKCCVNGSIYGLDTGHENKQPPGLVLTQSCHGEKMLDSNNVGLREAVQQNKDPVLREFLRLLALCHTVMVEERGDQLVYQAASPDEEALVLAARSLGYVFLSRTQDTITISEMGVTRTFQVLAMLDFNSDRKRMSVLVRDPQGTIRLYTKGADTVILERLRGRGPNQDFTERALDHFAEETLRTLCLASKELSEAEYDEWSRRHRMASILLQGRACELDRLYEEMEQDLELLGVTAIEDKLQEGVPETIQLLKLGNIKVWVLTGDKQETAMNVGYACKLLTDDMEILEEKEVSEMLEAYWARNNNVSGSDCASQQHPEPLCHKKRALVISGDFVDTILQTGEVLQKKGQLWQHLACHGTTDPQEQGSLVEKAFVDLATSCQAVICCRVTPKQKALIVQLVKKHKKATTLAIGDGANDVNMIKTADIGVGISGLEGVQAVQCSDFALAQFCYLQRLLLVHGRWAYLRICKFLRYFFYKTFAGLMTQIWFAFHSGFTAQPLYEGWFLALYNVFYTAYPVLSVGLLEQDVSAKKSLRFPELYTIGQQDKLFNYRIFSVTLLHGVSTSLTSFYIALWAFEDHVGSRTVGDYESFSITVATSALLSVLVEIILDTKFWTALSFLMVTASLLLFCLFSFLTQSFDAFRIAPAVFRFPGQVPQIPAVHSSQSQASSLWAPCQELFSQWIMSSLGCITSLGLDPLAIWSWVTALPADATRNALTDPYVLLVVLLSLVVNTIPSLTIRSYNAITGNTSIQQKICWKARREPEPSVELRTHVPRGSFHRRSSYAFSHQEGYAGLITRGESLRTKGTHSTTKGTHSTTKGTKGTHSTTKGTHSTTKGTKGTHSTTKGTHSTTKGTQGTHSTTKGTQGTHSTTKGTKGTHSTHSTTKGTHSTTKGTQGTHSTTKGTHSTTKGTHSTHSTTKGTQGTHSTTKGTHSTTKGTQGTHSITDTHTTNDTCATTALHRQGTNPNLALPP